MIDTASRSWHLQPRDRSSFFLKRYWQLYSFKILSHKKVKMRLCHKPCQKEHDTCTFFCGKMAKG